MFFTSAKISTDSIASSNTAQEGKQQTLNVHVHNVDVVKAGIIWILKSIFAVDIQTDYVTS